MKFVEKQKLSKKAQKELNAQKRNTWTMSPVQRVVPNKKAQQDKMACRAR